MLAAIAISLAATIDRAAAITQAEAIEKCWEQVRPLVQACVRQNVMSKGGPPAKYVESCRAPMGPRVRSCVGSLMAAENPTSRTKPAGRDIAPPVEPPAEAKVNANKLKLTRVPGFVAPPRSIADITAILDQEKPDPARTEELQKAADAEPLSRAGSKFYADRAHARVQLGRTAAAIADFKTALQLAPDLMSQDVYSVRQALALQYRASGDPKQSLQLTQDMLRNTDGPRMKGRQFYARRMMALNYINLGELKQAEATVASLEALCANLSGGQAQPICIGRPTAPNWKRPRPFSPKRAGASRKRSRRIAALSR